MFKFFSQSSSSETHVAEYSDNDKLYLSSVSKCQDLDIRNWNRNRPADNVRIDDILKYYNNKQITCIPGILSVWKNGSKYVIYDGGHRYFAGIDRLRDTGVDMTCLLRILSTEDEKEIVEDFCYINKAISVPTLYLEETVDTAKKRVCEHVTNYLCSKYWNFCSPSRKCLQYNFNRDIFMEFLSDLKIDFARKDVEAHLILELEGLKNYAKDHVMRNRIVTPRKCEFYNFYLFYLSYAFMKARIESNF
jgi:hypothetical protein